jgi:hypothetical protein
MENLLAYNAINWITMIENCTKRHELFDKEKCDKRHISINIRFYLFISIYSIYLFLYYLSINSSLDDIPPSMIFLSRWNMILMLSNMINNTIKASIKSIILYNGKTLMEKYWNKLGECDKK